MLCKRKAGYFFVDHSVLTTGKFRVDMIVIPEIVSDNTQVNTAKKISSQFIWQLHWISKEAPVDALYSEWC
jgi:hypothetical protein